MHFYILLELLGFFGILPDFILNFCAAVPPTLAHKPTFRVLLGAEIQEWPTAIPESHLLKLVQLSRKASGAIYRYRALLISRFQYRVLSISRSHILRFEIRGFYFQVAIGELFISAILRSDIFCEISAKNWMQNLPSKITFAKLAVTPTLLRLSSTFVKIGCEIRKSEFTPVWYRV